MRCTNVTKLSREAIEYVKLRREGIGIREAYKLAGFQGSASKTAPYEVEKRVKLYIQDGLESALQSEILARIKYIALDTLKKRKEDKLTQLEKMCLELAFDLSLIDIKQSRKSEKTPDAEKVDYTFNPKDLLEFKLKNEANSLSNIKDSEQCLKG